MAIKIRASIRIKDLQKIEDKLTKQFVNEDLVAKFEKRVVKNVIVDLIKKGISPVRGFGRFVGYKNPASYPGKGARRQKPSRPVNLTLTGEMMNAMGARRISGAKIEAGIGIEASKFAKNKAQWNNLGTEVDGKERVPARRFIPQKDEQWTVSVIREVKKLFTERVKELLSLR